MTTLTFVTGNPEKAKQLGRHLNHIVEHRKIDIPEIQSLNLEEVAIHKAKQAFEIVKSPVLVEDTSLVFNALGQLPGPLIKWFLNSLGNEGLTKILNSFTDRTALASVCFALCDENGVMTFKGEMGGLIANEPRGKKGFGWDPIFTPNGNEKTWGEMSAEEQDETSMRKIALQKLQTYLHSTL